MNYPYLLDLLSDYSSYLLLPLSLSDFTFLWPLINFTSAIEFMLLAKLPEEAFMLAQVLFLFSSLLFFSFILFYSILFYFILVSFYFILFCFVLFYFVLFCCVSFCFLFIFIFIINCSFIQTHDQMDKFAEILGDRGTTEQCMYTYIFL